MPEYKGFNYGVDKDGLWYVMVDADSKFIVALDDSKSSGKRKLIDSENSEAGCIKFIDHITQ